jgi:hypothetical protein
MLANDEEVLRELSESVHAVHGGAEAALVAETGPAYATGESPDEVVCEFSEALAANGYPQKRSDSTAAKYVKYMKYLFDDGTFTCRSEFFATGAQKRAFDAYGKRAAKVALDTAKRTAPNKLVANYMHGFDDYVRFCKP